MSQFYTFTIKDIEGKDFSFEQLKNKVILIVNTASKCGFTSQYGGLQSLYEKYKEKDFMILGFPSNDFLFQEPGTNAEINQFCSIKYGVDFKMMEKVHVRGGKQNELFKHLAQGDGNKKFAGPIKWNFTKFLIDRNGKIVGRFSPATIPDEIESTLINYL